jgi:hypothetical protein
MSMTPFRLPWLARDHDEITNQIVQMIDWAVVLLTDQFGRQLDFPGETEVCLGIRNNI